MEIALIGFLYGPSHMIWNEKQALNLASAAFSVKPCDLQEPAVDHDPDKDRHKSWACRAGACRRPSAASGRHELLLGLGLRRGRSSLPRAPRASRLDPRRRRAVLIIVFLVSSLSSKTCSLFSLRDSPCLLCHAANQSSVDPLKN